ncbi:MAG: diadenylate cyclase CdaA [Candidatus Omnitrophica bacterium]|nr:diadenylate cyclase CdaA [Candidatus Omnitrophota bacterium]MCM8827280.1 diadenylate cyclase CdaA [Candidatus Omnitrophota bacterium]
MPLFLKGVNWRPIVEIFILWLVIYRIFLFLKGTKAQYLLRGIVILIVAFFLSQKLGLYVMSWLLTKFFAFFLILVAIIFQPELREGLVRLGRRHIFYVEPKQEEVERTIREIVSATNILSKKKIGALIAIAREMGLKEYIESGVKINADVTSELIQTIFSPLSPLHDGGVIIGGIKVLSAGCLFPLTENPQLDRALGMRHRAGIGLSENSDALVIILSEETGNISLAINGQLTKDLSPADLHTILKGQLVRVRR